MRHVPKTAGGADCRAMSPSAEPASARAAVAGHLVPANLLTEGEIVILALKPSGWFLFIASMPVLASAAVVAGVAMVTGLLGQSVPREVVYSFCAAIGLLRMTTACWQWLGRTYVLTNRRAVCLRGLVNVRVQAAMLADIGRAELAVSLAERLFAAGSIVFLPIGERVPAVAWSAVARPVDVLEIVREAVGRSGRNRGT